MPGLMTNVAGSAGPLRGPALLGRRSRWLAAALLTALAAVVVLRAADGTLLRDGVTELASRPALLALLIGGYAAAFVLRAFAWRVLLGLPQLADGGYWRFRSC